MNILTFDIEEWYIEKIYGGARYSKYVEFDHFLGLLLDVLEEKNFKATFFCLGKIASEFPDVVKRIERYGHEIGCHSDKHLWLNKLNREEVFEDTRDAIDTLEQCIGKKVASYRAPAFSISEENKWAFEVLVACGITRDASIFPAVRDFGGFASFGQKVPASIFYKDINIKEFPVSTISLFGKEIVYSGGGYFRFFPLGYVQKKMRQSDYSMTYFHVGDLLSETKRFMSRKDYETYYKESGTFINRYKRYVKSNLGTKGSCEKLIRLIRTMDFVNLEQADSKIDWKSSPKVML